MSDTREITRWECPDCGLENEDGGSGQCDNYKAHPLGDYPDTLEVRYVPRSVMEAEVAKLRDELSIMCRDPDEVGRSCGQCENCTERARLVDERDEARAALAELEREKAGWWASRISAVKERDEARKALAASEARWERLLGEKAMMAAIHAQGEINGRDYEEIVRAAMSAAEGEAAYLKNPAYLKEELGDG